MTTDKTKDVLDALNGGYHYQYKDGFLIVDNPKFKEDNGEDRFLTINLTAQAEAQPAEDDVREAVDIVQPLVDDWEFSSEITWAIKTLIRAATAPKHTEEQWLKLFKTVAARTWTPEQALEHMKEDVSVCVATAPKTTDAPCRTCKGDPETCADVPSLRHCEIAHRPMVDKPTDALDRIEANSKINGETK